MEHVQSNVTLVSEWITVTSNPAFPLWKTQNCSFHFLAKEIRHFSRSFLLLQIMYCHSKQSLFCILRLQKSHIYVCVSTVVSTPQERSETYEHSCDIALPLQNVCSWIMAELLKNWRDPEKQCVLQSWLVLVLLCLKSSPKYSSEWVTFTSQLSSGCYLILQQRYKRARWSSNGTMST